MTIRVQRVLALVACLGLTIVTPANAHENGVIRLSAKQLPVGGSLTVNGDKLGKGTSYRLELRGALKTFSFGRVRADTSGRFAFTVTLPADAAAGAYTVALVASDGDVSARADLLISGAAPAASASHDMANMPGMAMPGMNMPHATAEYLPIARTTTTAGWIVIILIIGGSALGGIALLRRRPATRSTRIA